MILKINGFENDINFSKDNVNVIEVRNARCFSHLLGILKMNFVTSFG